MSHRLCRFPFRRTLQRKNMMAANHRHIGGGENRLVGTTADFLGLAHGFSYRSITCSVARDLRPASPLRALGIRKIGVGPVVRTVSLEFDAPLDVAVLTMKVEHETDPTT